MMRQLPPLWTHCRNGIVGSLWLLGCAAAAAWIHFDPNPCGQAVLVVMLAGWGIVASGSPWVVAAWVISCGTAITLSLSFGGGLWLWTTATIVGAVAGDWLRRSRSRHGNPGVNGSPHESLRQELSSAQRQIAHLQSRLSLLTESLPMGVFEADVAGRCQFLTPHCAEVFGVSFLDAFIGSWFDHLHPADRVEASENWRISWQRQEPLSIECRVIAKEGGYRWIHVRCRPLLTDRGSVYLSTVEVITEQRRAARQLQHLAESLDRAHQSEQAKNRQLKSLVAELTDSRNELQNLTRHKSEFLANMSHEIRTPMTAILGFTEVLLDDSDPQLPWTAPLATIHRNADYLLSLLDDILDMSKVEAGQIEIESVPCSPRQIVDDVLELMQVRLGTRDVTLSCNIEAPFPATIHSDPTRLKQILVNLVGNAIKFTEQGAINVELALASSEGSAGASATAHELEIRVTDTGIGMSPDQLSRLFKPFSQGDATTARKYGGTGLGLTICKVLAEKLGGDLRVRSAPGQGSTFTLRVPAFCADFSAAGETRPAGGAGGERTSSGSGPQLPERSRVLVVEDGLDNQRLLAFLLGKAGAEVSIANNGAEAILSAMESLRADTPFDAIVMDMRMPVMDGMVATRRLRAAGCLTPIIALTASTMPGDREKCLEAGCDEYACKPIRRSELLATLRTRIEAERERRGRSSASAAIAGRD